MKKLIFTLVLSGISIITFSQITDNYDHIQLVSRTKDTTYISKSSISYVKKASASPNYVDLKIKGENQPLKLKYSDFGYANTQALRVALLAALYKEYEDPWLHTYPATADTMIFQNIMDFAVAPLTTNSDTVKIHANSDSLGMEAAGYYYMIGPTAPPYSKESRTGAPLKYFRVITKTNAGCVISATPY